MKGREQRLACSGLRRRSLTGAVLLTILFTLQQPKRAEQGDSRSPGPGSGLVPAPTLREVNLSVTSAAHCLFLLRCSSWVLPVGNSECAVSSGVPKPCGLCRPDPKGSSGSRSSAMTTRDHAKQWQAKLTCMGGARRDCHTDRVWSGGEGGAVRQPVPVAPGWHGHDCRASSAACDTPSPLPFIELCLSDCFPSHGSCLLFS